MARTGKLLLIFLLAVLVSACPEKKKTSTTGSAKCETISNAQWVADNCICLDKYQKHELDDGGMRCDLVNNATTCLGRSRRVSGQCQ